MSAENVQIKGNFKIFLNKVLKSTDIYIVYGGLNSCPNLFNDVRIVTILNYLTAEHVWRSSFANVSRYLHYRLQINL